MSIWLFTLYVQIHIAVIFLHKLQKTLEGINVYDDHFVESCGFWAAYAEIMRNLINDVGLVAAVEGNERCERS